MPELIGNAGIKAMAWAEGSIESFSPRARRGKTLEEFTSRHPQRLSPNQIITRDSGKETVASRKAYPDTEMYLSSPANNRIETNKHSEKIERVIASERPETNRIAEEEPELTPQMNTGEIADRVYRLMQHDLIIEKDRTYKPGG